MKKKWIVAGCLSFSFALSLLLALPDGQADYKNLCLKCHGAEGKGDGPVTKMVKNQSMGDLSSTEAMTQYSAEDLYKLISEGGEAVGKAKLMPAHKEKLGESEIQAILAYMKTFQK